MIDFLITHFIKFIIVIIHTYDDSIAIQPVAGFGLSNPIIILFAKIAINKCSDILQRILLSDDAQK